MSYIAGDYKMIGTPEETLLKYPDNFQDLIDLATRVLRR